MPWKCSTVLSFKFLKFCLFHLSLISLELILHVIWGSYPFFFLLFFIYFSVPYTLLSNLFFTHWSLMSFYRMFAQFHGFASGLFFFFFCFTCHVICSWEKSLIFKFQTYFFTLLFPFKKIVIVSLLEDFLLLVHLNVFLLCSWEYS